MRNGGLRTSLELLRRNVPICLRSTNPPTHSSTCSMGAGGLWMPFKSDDPRVHGKWAMETLDELLGLVAKSKKIPVESNIEVVPTLYLTKTLHYDRNDDSNDICTLEHSEDGSYNEIPNSNGVYPLPKWTHDPRLSFRQLTMEMLSSQNKLLKLRIPSQTQLIEAGYKY